MMDKIIINKAQTQATIYFNDGRQFNLHHSDGLVLDLIQDLFYGLSRVESSLEVTQVIENDSQLSFDFMKVG